MTYCFQHLLDICKQRIDFFWFRLVISLLDNGMQFLLYLAHFPRHPRHITKNTFTP